MAWPGREQAITEVYTQQHPPTHWKEITGPCWKKEGEVCLRQLCAPNFETVRQFLVVSHLLLSTQFLDIFGIYPIKGPENAKIPANCSIFKTFLKNLFSINFCKKNLNCRPFCNLITLQAPQKTGSTTENHLHQNQNF